MTVELPPLPARMTRLPRDHRGFPVPWFVQWYKDGKPGDHGVGEPDFRVADTRKLARAIKHNLCWTCGDPLGRHRVFVIGPMCAINRTISEPPSHRECAEFSAKACPFLSRPRMRRNEKDLDPQRVPPGGIGIARNPGAICLWETKDYSTFRAQFGHDGVLFRLGEPTRIDWWVSGRTATRAEVLESIDSGFPELERVARLEGPEAVAALNQYRARVMPLLPAA
jgi:hypothetical protein